MKQKKALLGIFSALVVCVPHPGCIESAFVMIWEVRTTSVVVNDDRGGSMPV